MPNNNYSKESNKPEDEEVTRSARFKATRAILNVQTQAKITDGSFKPRTIICKILPNGSPRRAFNEYGDKDEK